MYTLLQYPWNAIQFAVARFVRLGSIAKKCAMQITCDHHEGGAWKCTVECIKILIRGPITPPPVDLQLWPPPHWPMAKLLWAWKGRTKNVFGRIFALWFFWIFLVPRNVWNSTFFYFMGWRKKRKGRSQKNRFFSSCGKPNFLPKLAVWGDKTADILVRH